MKKNFFKKLSFVLALAMIVSIIAPAAGAFAATSPKLNLSSKTLLLAQDGRDEFDFNVVNKPTGAKGYAWSSSNEDVAVVDDAGLTTAVAPGKATISVVITKKDGTKKTLKASVVVKSNIKTVTITNKPENDTLAIGAEWDFNRSYVTFSGAKTGTTSVTRWVVLDDKGAVATGAAISASGLFKATQAGTYTVVAASFQSTAKYEAYLTSQDASLVLDTDTYNVTVKAGIKEVKQVDIDTFQITFDSAVTDLAANLTVSSVVSATNTKVKQTVQTVTMSADNTVATVDMYVDFTDETTYVVDVTGFDSKQFVSADTDDYTEVTDMTITTTKAAVNEATDLVVKLFNKDGVDISSTSLLSRVTFASSNAYSYYDSTNKELTLYTVGDTTTITATFHTYTYDTTTGKETGTIVKTGTVTCVDATTTTYGNVAAYTILTTGSTPDYDAADVEHLLAVGDTGKSIYANMYQYNTYVDAAKTTLDPYISTTESSLFTFDSSDKSVLMVTSAGVLFPVKAGTATVVVSYNGTVVGSVNVTVSPARAATNLTLSAYTASLSNDTDVDDSATITATLTDQYGDAYAFDDLAVTLQTSSSTDDLLAAFSADDLTNDGIGTFTVGGTIDAAGATSATAGTYTYAVSAEGVTKYLVVTILAPTSGTTTTSYKLKLSSKTFDTAVYDLYSNYTEDLTIQVYGYAANGVANNVVATTGAGYYYTITPPTTSTYSVTDGALSTTVSFVKCTSGAAVVKAATGTYVIKLYKVGSTTPVDVQYVTVANTQLAPTVSTVTLLSTSADILTAITDCFDFTYDGSSIDSQVYLGTAGTDYFVSGDNIFVKYVYWKQTLGNGATITYTISVNANILYN